MFEEVMFQFFLQLSKAVAWRCSVKKVFLKIPQKFTGKYLCWSQFYYKAVGLQLTNL